MPGYASRSGTPGTPFVRIRASAQALRLLQSQGDAESAYNPPAEAIKPELRYSVASFLHYNMSRLSRRLGQSLIYT